MTNAALSFSQLLRTLADPTRLRLLRLLSIEELSVNEIAEATALAQPRVSNHLKLLREEQLVEERREGAWRYYRVDESALPERLRALWPTIREACGDDPEMQADAARLEAVLARRGERGEFFERFASEWDGLRAELFGDGLTRALFRAFVPRGLTVADIGAGTGHAVELFGDRPARLICIDRSEPMLAIARGKVDALGLTNVEFRVGDAHTPPLEPGEVEFAMLTMVLHHLDRPGDAVAGVARGIAPGGALFLADFLPHQALWMRTNLSHHHLGFGRTVVEAWLAESGLAIESWTTLPGRTWTTPEGNGVRVPDGFALLARRTSPPTKRRTAHVRAQ